jgi:hypothetical protein
MAQSKIASWLDLLKNHRTWITVSIGFLVVVLRCIILPHDQWLELMLNDNLSWLILAFGGTYGISKVATGARNKLSDQTQE